MSEEVFSRTFRRDFISNLARARLDFCRGRIPQPRRLAGALTIKRGAVPMLTHRSGEITLSIYDGPSATAVCTRISGLRGRLVTKYSTGRDATQSIGITTIFLLLSPFLRRRLRVNAAGRRTCCSAAGADHGHGPGWMGGRGRGPAPGVGI
jgi:hypothetical protein